MADRIQLRRDTKANWESYNPILLEGEPGHVLDYPNLYKMGDGVHAWNDLPYRGYDGTVLQDVQYDVENAVPSSNAVFNQRVYSSQISPSLITDSALTVDTNRFHIVTSGTKNLLVFRYDGKSKSVNIDGIDYTSNNTVWWLMKDWDNWQYSSYIGFCRKQIPNSLLSYNGLKYIALEYVKSENQSFDPTKAFIDWRYDSDLRNEIDAYNHKQDGKINANTASISETISTNLTATKLAGQFPSREDGHIINNQNVDSYVFENIDLTKTYKVKGFGFDSAGYGNIAFVHYYNGETWLGIDEDFFIVAGPYYQTEYAYLLNIPSNCNKVVIITQNVNGAPILTEQVIKNRISIEDVKNNPINKEIQLTILTSTTIPGKYINQRGEVNELGSMTLYVYTGIISDKTYYTRGFGVPSSVFTGVAFVHYYSGDFWLGCEQMVAAGPYYQKNAILLHVPVTCNKIIISTYYQYYPLLEEVHYGNSIPSDCLQRNIDELKYITGKLSYSSILFYDHLEGQYPSMTDGRLTKYNPTVDSYIFTGINSDNKYQVRNFTSGGKWNNWSFVNYYKDDTWLGYDSDFYHYELTHSEQLDWITLNNIPNECNKIIIITNHDYNYVPEIRLCTINKSLILSNEIDSAISETISTNLTATKLAGQFPSREDGHIIDNQNVDSYVFENIDLTKTYKAKDFGFDSAGYTSIAFVHYYNGETWIGIDEDFYVAAGPYYQTEYAYLNVPSDCNKIVIITQNINGAPILTEQVKGSYISSQELKEQIEKNASDIEKIEGVDAKIMKVTKSGSTLYMRTALNDNEDIILSYIKRDNNEYTWGELYLGSNTLSDSEILQNQIKSMQDATGALGITDPAPWHLWVQHGYCIPYITATHSLTSEDIGSVWKDQRDRQYKIGNISGNTIYLLPIVRETEFSGVYTRDWKSPTSVNHPEITSLTHVSGATHTTTISVTNSSNTQLRPMMVLNKRLLLADGKEITEDGIYYCDDFVIGQTFHCTDPWTVQTWFPVTQVEVGAILTETFTMHGLSCRYDTILDMKKSYIFSWYGGNQIQHFVPTNKLSGYDVYGLMPRAKQYAVPHLVNDTTRAGETVYRRTEDLYDINKMVDRYITYFKNNNTGDMKIGCAGGYSLTRGATKDSNRNQLIRVYQSGDRDCMSVIPNLGNKAYLKLLTDSNFENAILPASYIVQLSSYLSYFDPMANTGQVYWYKDTDGYVIYAHYQTAQNKTAIQLPKDMEGLSVEVVDKTDGVTLLTDIVSNGRIYINADNTDHNYIVLKTVR